MKDKERQLIEGNMDFISFKEFVELVTGTSFDEVYKDFLLNGAKHDETDMA